MAHRGGGPGWPGRGPRLYRPDSGGGNYGPFPGRGGSRAPGVGPRGFRGGPPMPILRPRHPPPPHPPASTPLSPPHPPVVSYRHRGDELSGGSGREGILQREQYDYGHGRDRSRSPYASSSRETQYGTKQHCDINALLRDESMKITVGNDKFKDPQQAGSGVHSSSASQNAILPVSRAPPTTKYAEETASVARAKEMAMRTREMLSKLTGWTPISLQPVSAESAAKTGGKPNVVNISNSAYTKLSASSDVAKTILRSMNAVAAAFCPKESGGVAHIRYTGGSEKAAKEDEDRFLYGEDLVPKNPEKQPLVENSAIKSALRKQAMSSGVETPVRIGEMGGSNCDPVVADVLKSIGFNFELSKIMQEKAKKEREENDRNRLLIQQASSFLAKQLAMADASDGSVGAKSFENLRIVVNKSAEPDEILMGRPKERKKQTLYDDFSNSEDEFCESERSVNVAAAAASNDSITQPQTVSVVGSLPSSVTFPSSAPFSAALLPTPPVAFPLSSSVPLPQMAVPPPPPHQILLPPQVLSHQPLMPQPVWPGYRMLGANSLSKKKTRTGPHLSDEVEWEQNTEDFLRKLQEPRTNDAPPKPGAKVPPRSSVQDSSDSERQRYVLSRRRKRNASESPEPMKRRRKFGRKDSKNRFEDDEDGQWNSSRRLASLREKLRSVKKEHSGLMCIRQKSAYVKDKLVRTARLQCKLMDEIEELGRAERRGDRHEAAASGEESLPDYDRKKTDPKRASQARPLNRKLRENNKERNQKTSGSKEASPDQRLSRTKVTRQSAEEQPKPSASVEPEKPVQNSGIEVKSETSGCSKSEIVVQVKEEIASQGTKTESKSSTGENTELKDAVDPSKKLEVRKSKKVKLRYDYYDGGNNRCSVCAKTFAKLVEFLQHLHSEAHDRKVDHHKVGKPWTLNRSLQPKPHNSVPPISVPASGMEFMRPIQGFFCALCSRFSGDCEDAELHVLSEEHNDKFKEHCLVNPAHLNESGIIKAETLKTEKSESREAAGAVNDDDDDDKSNFFSETSKDDFESTGITRANQLAAKDTSIPAGTSDGAAAEKFPLLRNAKERNSEEKMGGSREEVDDEPEPMLDTDDGGSSSEALKLRGSKMKAHSDEVKGFGDPGAMKVSPPGTLTVEPSKDIGFLNGGTCSLVPYEDAEDNDLDLGTPSAAEMVSVKFLPEKSEIDDEECANVCDVVNEMSKNETALVLRIVCPMESDAVVSDERVESPICPLEGPLSSREKQNEATGFRISGDMSVTESSDSSERREILLGESIESTEPMVLDVDESSRPVVSAFPVQSHAAKHLLEENSNASQSLESSVLEEEDKVLLPAEQPYLEQFEVVDLSFDDALEGFHFMKTSEASPTSVSGTVVNCDAVEPCATGAFYSHDEPVKPLAVQSSADVRRLEADVRCLEAPAADANEGVLDTCDATAADSKNIATCRSYLADVMHDAKGTDGTDECTDDYAICLDDDDDDNGLEAVLTICGEVVPDDDEGKCQDETRHRLMGEGEAGNNY